MTRENWPKFVQIISHKGNIAALDELGDIWFYVTAHELHTGEKISSHWAPIQTMERRP